MTEEQDAPGLAMLEFLEGTGGPELIERDDGNIEPSGGPDAYFADPSAWGCHEMKALRYARGRVLDVGCGAGRISLYLQEKGHEVVGIDTSPGAVEVSNRRGVLDARLMSVTQVGPELGPFDTIVMYGNNFGLFANWKRARWLLRRFRGLTGESGRIVAESLDPYRTEDERHLAYHVWNRRRGRMGGQVRIRVRYKTRRTPWFDYLLVSQDEMQSLLEGTGWRIEGCFESESPMYSVVIGRA